MSDDVRKIAQPDDYPIVDTDTQLDEYGHPVGDDGVSLSGPASPGHHAPDVQRLLQPEFEADLAGQHGLRRAGQVEDGAEIPAQRMMIGDDQQ